MNPDPPLSQTVEPARGDELAPALRLIFRHLGPADREVRVGNALEMIRRGEFDPTGILVVRGKRGLLGAMIGLPVPGAGALVWPPQTDPRAAGSRDLEDCLVRATCRRLREGGAKLVQALLAPHESPLAPPLERNGFSHVTSLWYMKHDLRFPAGWSPGGQRLAYRTYAEGDPDLFHQTLLRTYEQTRDCPELNGVREVREIIEGHRNQGKHDPHRWWLALEGDTPAGVLLATEVPETAGWDLSYVGVVPEARGRGVGREMVRKVLADARDANARQLTLAVDVRNQPAWDLYRSLGFEPQEMREVFLAIWPSGST